MKSEHIDNRKLADVVAEQAVLNKWEIEHMQACEVCLQSIRVSVEEQLSKRTGHIPS
jgi:hypothetical protein